MLAVRTGVAASPVSEAVPRLTDHGLLVHRPYGDPIPSSDGHAPTPPAPPLSALEACESGRVARIFADQPDTLRGFTSIGLGPDVRVAAVERRAFAGVIRVVAVAPSPEPVDLGDLAARAVWVST